MTTNQVDTHSTLHKVLTEINDTVERLKFEMDAEGVIEEIAENLDSAEVSVEDLKVRRSDLLAKVAGQTAGIEQIDQALARRGVA